MKCVGTLTKCPYTAGGRSRRGSPKAGTTVVDMTKRRKMEVLCVHEAKWSEYRTRKMAEGYNMLHGGGDGNSNGVLLLVSL